MRRVTSVAVRLPGRSQSKQRRSKRMRLWSPSRLLAAFVANARFEKRRLAQRLRQFSALFVSLLCACSCLAGVRHFTYVYEAITSPPGSFDLENWITWRTHAPNDRDFDQIDLRHELEFGITDNLQAAVYVADWNYQNAIGSEDRKSVV